MHKHTAVATSLAFSFLTATALAQGVPCPGAELVPTGQHDDPAEPFQPEHYEVTAGMPLQGNRASVKYAPVMVPWNQLDNPDDPNGNVADFQTVFVVDNPDANVQLIVDVDFFNADGTLASTLQDLTLEPRGHLQREVGPDDLYGPNGMIRVTVDPASPAEDFVGATIYFAGQVIDPLEPLGSGSYRFDRAMSSMQPLQQYQTQLGEDTQFGPIPVRLLTGIDSTNGLFAFQNICNPSATATTLTVTLQGAIGGPVTTTYPLAANGTVTVLDAWNYAASVYPTLTQDHDVVVTFQSSNGQPVLGENIFIDLRGGDAGDTVDNGGSQGSGAGGGGAAGGGGGSALVNEAELGTFLGRVRMSSMMLGYTPKARLISPEFTDTTFDAPAPIQSTLGVCNVDAQPTGDVVVEYFDNLGAWLGTDVIPSLPQYGTALIGVGLAQTPNFPVVPTFKGSVRVRACSGQIIGWANRASENPGNLQVADAPKMWGELLHRAGGWEHRVGWIEGTTRNKIAPLVLHDLQNVIPSYVAIANHRSSNTDAYAYTFFDRLGAATGFAAYAGLPSRTTPFTYLEPLIMFPSTGSFSDIHHHMGLVSNRTKSVEGIQTIGGRIDFYLRFEGGLPYYPGPGDTVN